MSDTEKRLAAFHAALAAFHIPLWIDSSETAWREGAARHANIANIRALTGWSERTVQLELQRYECSALWFYEQMLSGRIRSDTPSLYADGRMSYDLARHINGDRRPPARRIRSALPSVFALAV